MSEPIWSRRFAADVAKILGYSPDEAAPGGKAEDALLADLTENFRYLPGEQVNWVFDLAEFLRGREAGARPPGWAAAKLHEVRDYQAFLRSRYGSEHAADESNEWSDEDRREFAAEALRRLDEGDPYFWQGGAGDGPAG